VHANYELMLNVTCVSGLSIIGCTFSFLSHLSSNIFCIYLENDRHLFDSFKGNVYWVDEGSDIIEVVKLNSNGSRYVIVHGEKEKPTCLIDKYVLFLTVGV
jgi:hypothetical protein